MKKILFILILFSIRAGTSFAIVTGFDATISYSNCDYASVAFHCNLDTIFPGENFCWDFGDSSKVCISDINTTSNSYSKLGNYTVTLTYILNGDSTIFIKPNLITIRDTLPIADFSYTPAVDTSKYIYAPATINFMNKSQKGEGDLLKYSWNLGDTTSSTDTNVVHTFLKTGIYTVNLHVTDNYGCFADASKTLCIQTSSSPPYHPFPTKNTLWTEAYYNPYPDEYSLFHAFALKDGDTTIKGKLYHKIYHSTDTIFTENKLCGGIREENKKIYYYSIDSLPYQYNGIQADTEVILYDFNLMLGDTIKNDQFRISYPGGLVIEKVDSILIGNAYCRSFRFGYSPTSIISWATWTESVGSLRGLLFETGDVPGSGLFNDLICLRKDNEILYHYSYYSKCYYDNPDVLRENVIKGMVTINPNPVVVSFKISFPEGYRKLQVINLYGITVNEYNVSGHTSIEISREGMPSGIYLIRLTGVKVPGSTIKAIFK